MVGGSDGSHPLRQCYIYDPTTEEWGILPAMNRGRRSHGVVSVNDCHLYAFGGYGLSCTERLNVGIILDGEGGGDGKSGAQWCMCPGNMLFPSNTGRCYFGFWSIGASGSDGDDTYIYCAGGYAAGDRNERDVQRYSVCSGEWKALPPLPDRRWSPSVVVVRDSDRCHVITVIGGRYNESRKTIVYKCYESMVASGGWKRIAAALANSIGIPRKIQRKQMGTETFDGNVVLVGGFGSRGDCMSDVVSSTVAVPNMPLGGRYGVAIAVV